jgi:Nif-specific regulatory protein
MVRRASTDYVLMRENVHRIRNLAAACAALLEQEGAATREKISALMESVRAIQGERSDRRLLFLNAELKRLQEHFNLLMGMARSDFLAKIQRETEELDRGAADSRLAAVLKSLIEAPPSSLHEFCTFLLDRLIEATGAERGFILFYLSDSTEADVVAARNFQTTNLALEEYDFSRTLLREVLQQGKALLLADASQTPAYATETSVMRYQLKSVLVAPLRSGDRTFGAIYLENNRIPRAFQETEPELLESVAGFAVFCLHHAHLLPPTLGEGSHVFLDASKASREIVGRDPKILAMLEGIRRIADSPATVLIDGESGTGKELVARALHYQSARSERPFVAINCAAIPESLLEADLFGYEKGAFTGATERYLGRIERGDGGTIFFDEISELAHPLQAKLLRFLQANEFERLGGKESIRVDVRVVAATSRDLKQMMAAGTFQESLYYRLNVIPLRLPALRERREDIPVLADYFLQKFGAVYGSKVGMEPEVYDFLRNYSFPGNVRELENLIHRMVALAPEATLRVGDLPKEIFQGSFHRVSLANDPLCQILHTPPHDLADLHRRKEEIRRVLAEQEIYLAQEAVREAGGNISDAARRLGVHRVTLHKTLRGKKA